jgi:hypothetical protein
MKVKLPRGLHLINASALGYLMGTEAGREHRDSLVRIIRRQNDIIEAEVATAADGEPAAEAVSTEG